MTDVCPDRTTLSALERSGRLSRVIPGPGPPLLVEQKEVCLFCRYNAGATYFLADQAPICYECAQYLR